MWWNVRDKERNVGGTNNLVVGNDDVVRCH